MSSEEILREGEMDLVVAEWRRNTILRDGKEVHVKRADVVRQCITFEDNEQLSLQLEILRRGYPEQPMEKQCQGTEFRKAANVVTSQLAREVNNKLSNDQKAKAVVVMPWRAGLAFAGAFKNNGVNNFSHLDSKRDEKTAEAKSGLFTGEFDTNSVVIIADPMVATGGSVIDAIEKVLDKGTKPENIIVSCVVAAPVGVANIKALNEKIQIYVASLDEKVDHRAYIVPGLGDFGDKYFANIEEGDYKEFITDVLELDLDEDVGKRLLQRFLKPNEITG